MAYKCFDCAKEITAKEIERRIICPYCGSRVIAKSRPGTVKHVKAC